MEMGAPWLRQCEHCGAEHPWGLKEKVFVKDLMKWEKKMMIFSRAAGCWGSRCPKGARRSITPLYPTWLRRALPPQGTGEDTGIHAGRAPGRGPRLRSCREEKTAPVLPALSSPVPPAPCRLFLSPHTLLLIPSPFEFLFLFCFVFVCTSRQVGS